MSWKDAEDWARYTREGTYDEPDCAGCGAEHPVHRIDGSWWCTACARAEYPERLRDELTTLTNERPSGAHR
jgi:hypothetical protein